MPATVLEVLMNAKELIRDRDNWTQGTMARDKNGKGVLAYSPDAVCFCVTGALTRCGWNTDSKVLNLVSLLVQDAAFALFDEGPVIVNDARRIRNLKRAITREQAFIRVHENARLRHRCSQPTWRYPNDDGKGVGRFQGHEANVLLS